MSDNITADTKQLLETELGSYGDELVDGAASTLAALWAHGLRGANQETIAEEVAKRLTDPKVRKYRNAEFKGGQSHLRRALARNVDKLRDGDKTVDQLTKEWSTHLGTRPPHLIAKEVTRRLNSEEYAEHLKNPPEPRPAIVRLESLLSEHFGDVLDKQTIVELARKWGDLSPLPDHQAIRNIAQRLSTRKGALLTADQKRLHPDDPRFKAQPTTGGKAPRRERGQSVLS